MFCYYTTYSRETKLRSRILVSICRHIEYKTLFDIKMLLGGLFESDKLAIAAMGTRREDDAATSPGRHVTLSLPSGGSSNDGQHSVSLPVNGIKATHLLSFFPSEANLTPTYQTAAVDAPQPDDPFDDIYALMNGREKKRKLLNEQLSVSTKGDEGFIDAKIPKSQVRSSTRFERYLNFSYD